MPSTPVFPAKDGEMLGYERSVLWHNKWTRYHGAISIRLWDGLYHGICYALSEDGIVWLAMTLDHVAFPAQRICDR